MAGGRGLENINLGDFTFMFSDFTLIACDAWCDSVASLVLLLAPRAVSELVPSVALVPASVPLPASARTPGARSEADSL